MLSDPLQFDDGTTYLNLPRVSGSKPGTKKLVGSTTYRTAEGDHALFIRRELNADDTTRIEVILERRHFDSTPFDAGLSSLVNRVGMVFEVNDYLHNTPADLSDLRNLLDIFLDEPTIGRLVGGES